MDDASAVDDGASALDVSGYALHHIAVVVRDVEAAAGRYGLLGFGGGEHASLPDQSVRVVTFRAGGGWVELIEPTDPEGPIARFLNSRGEGLHHVAYRVDDIEGTLARLQAAGVRLIDVVPRAGVHDWRIAFVHPESCAGVLTELVEEPAA